MLEVESSWKKSILDRLFLSLIAMSCIYHIPIVPTVLYWGSMLIVLVVDLRSEY